MSHHDHIHNLQYEDPTDGRGFVSQSDPKINPGWADNAAQALLRSKRRADYEGREWTPIDAFLAVRRFVKRRYR